MTGGTAQTASNRRLSLGMAGGLATLVAACLLFAPVAAGSSKRLVASVVDLTLSVDKAGSCKGTVTSKPTGIDCGGTCSAKFAQNSRPALIARPDAGSTCEGWSEPSCANTSVCYVSLDKDKSVTATFVGSSSTLSVSKTGSGTVTSTPDGIACGNTCSAQFKTGTDVSLVAVADQGWRFQSWGGACSDNGGCGLSLDGDKSVTATFVKLSSTLSVSKTGSGTVTSTPAGIACGNTCSAQFRTGTDVALNAVADQGWKFLNWGGACSGNGACNVPLDGDKSVTATFEAVGAPPARGTLTVTRQGSGSGSVRSDPAGISCGAACSATYPPGTKVNLSAAASDNSTFTGWGGACSGTADTCAVTVTAVASVTASFAAKDPTQPAPPAPPPATPPTAPKTPPPAVTPEIDGFSQPEPPAKVTIDTANPRDVKSVAELAAGVTGNGLIEQEVARGTLAVQAAGIRCGFNQFRCYTRLDPGQRVVLRARPLANYVFSAWTGACAGQGPRCVVVAHALRTVTALFTPRTAVASVGFDVSQISVRVKWLRSVGSGQIIVSGRIGGPAALRVQVRRPGGGPLITRRLAVAGGSFRNVIPRPPDGG